MASASSSSTGPTPSAETGEESSPEPLLPSKVPRISVRPARHLVGVEEVQHEAVAVSQEAADPTADDPSSKSGFQPLDSLDSFVAALTGQELKTEDSVRPPFAVSQSALPLAVTNPSVDVGVRSRLVAKDASFSGSLALIAIALPHGSLPGVLLAKEPEARQVADPTYPKPATVTIVSDDEDEEEEVASQDVTQETTLPSDQDSVEKASSSSSSSEEDSVFDPELMSSYTLEELDYRRICSVRDLALFLQEVSNVHRYGREACFQTQHTDRHSLRKNVARGIVQNREASARERELQEMEDGLKELERALHLRGGLTPGHVEEFLGTRTPSQLFNRHFELWNYYNAVVKRKTDLQFSLGSLDGPYTFQMPPEDVAETRITLVKKITEADTICGRVSLELLALETFMYK